jgi:predicted RNase H-like HicB family nuclease
MSFSSLSQLDNEEYVEKMRGAIEAGFEDAKNILGELPGPKAKLFNDTYEKVMTKLDELLDSSLQREVQENTSDEIIPQLRNTFDLVA